MPASGSFGDVLDAAIAAGAARATGPGIATAALMNGPLSIPLHGRSAYDRWALPPRQARRHHPRTREERQAFERIQAAGAALSSSFTADELRRAFRRLARELHPDRHRDLSPAERTHLGYRFASMREDYLLLSQALSS